MRKLILGVALVIGVFFAVPSEACEECAQYFDYQSLSWCSYCRVSYCGFFNCRIRNYYYFGDYCEGDDAGCFEYGGGCPGECNPDDPNSCVLHQARLDEAWRLLRVSVHNPGQGRAPMKAAQHVTKG